MSKEIEQIEARFAELGEVEVRRRLAYWILWGSEDRRLAWICEGGDPALYGGMILPPPGAVHRQTARDWPAGLQR